MTIDNIFIEPFLKVSNKVINYLIIAQNVY